MNFKSPIHFLRYQLFSLIFIFIAGIVNAQAPSAPSNLNIIPTNTGGVIKFTKPASIGGSPITNYEYSLDNGVNWNTPSRAITESPIILNSGLTNCTTYQIKVRAVNASGSGDPSLAADLTPTQSYSPGVSTWKVRTSAADNSWRSVTYGNGLFVAVSSTGTGNRVMTSPDGITWTSRTSAADNPWQCVTYGNGLFVAVSNTGTNNRVMTSPDGINWTSVTVPNYTWEAITYANGLFVAVGNTAIMTSPDGITWTVRASPVNASWNTVAYGNGRFVSFSTSSDKRIMSSDDGINWVTRVNPSINSFHQVTFGNGIFVAVDNLNGKTLTSPDGINWTLRDCPRRT